MGSAKNLPARTAVAWEAISAVAHEVVGKASERTVEGERGSGGSGGGRRRKSGVQVGADAAGHLQREESKKSAKQDTRGYTCTAEATRGEHGRGRAPPRRQQECSQ